MFIDSLTVIIVSYNSYGSLVKCMDEWLKTPNCRVLIVDNASTDDTVAQLAARYANIEILPQAHNLGYGRGANVGLNQVNTRYALLLNPDMRVDAAGIHALHARATTTDTHWAILAPAVTEKDRLNAGIVEREWLIGAAMLFDMTALAAVGQFDEQIFLFSEETDLCRRLRAAGWLLLLDSGLYWQHLLQQSSTPSPRIEHLKHWHKGWSRMYYRRKHGLNTGKKAEWRVLLSFAIRTLTATRSSKRAMHRAKFQGSLAFVRGEPAFKPDGSPQQAP